MAIKKRVFCDTNLLLDLCDPERSRHSDAVALLWYAVSNPNKVELVASITSFKDSYYILSRLYHDAKAARNSIGRIMGAFVRPVDMLASYGSEALDSNEPDFEDGLIRACAEHERATVIISSDVSAFHSSMVKAMPAADFLALEGFDYGLVDF